MENNSNCAILIITSLFFILVLTSCRENAQNLVQTVDEWYAETDPHGSTYTFPNDELVNNGVVSVHFNIAEREEVDSWYPFAMIICNPGYTLEGYSAVSVVYRSDIPLFVELPQTETRENGDEFTLFYRYRLPASEEWNSQRVSFSHFIQPTWAPLRSLMVPLNTQNIDAIHFLPDLDYGHGGSARVSIRHLELHD